MEIINELKEISVQAGVFLVPIVTGLVQVLKPVAGKALTPALSVVVGTVLTAALIGFSTIGIISGITVGLAASGLYDFGKSMK